MEWNHISYNCCRNQKQVKTRHPLVPSVLLEHNNGKTVHEKAEGRKHYNFIDAREAKNMSDNWKEVKARPNPMKHKSLLSMFLDQCRNNKQELVAQVMGLI